MKKIIVISKGIELSFYRKNEDVDPFIIENISEWGYPEEIEIKVMEWKNKKTIIAEIFAECEDTPQQMRLATALDSKSSFSAALENDNYDLARYKMSEAYNEGLITNADMTLVNNIIPTGDVE